MSIRLPRQQNTGSTSQHPPQQQAPRRSLRTPRVPMRYSHYNLYGTKTPAQVEREINEHRDQVQQILHPETFMDVHDKGSRMEDLDKQTICFLCQYAFILCC